MLHPILNDFETKIIEIFSFNKGKYDYSVMNKFDLPEIKDYSLTDFKGNIDWKLIEPAYTFDYSALGNQNLIDVLSSSKLKNTKSLVLELGYTGPVIEVKTNDFINFWEEILHASVEGFPVISKDGTRILEFIRNPELIYSNFPLV
ncbi:MAG: hypothetical protein AAGG59_15130 [Bacteroidota bacterium]